VPRLKLGERLAQWVVVPAGKTLECMGRIRGFQKVKSHHCQQQDSTAVLSPTELMKTGDNSGCQALQMNAGT
jgi:hypothetical protein